MAYSPTAFVDNTAPAISATELNKIGAGIEDAHARAQPAHVFRVADYGAVGDGILVSDLSVSNGSGVVTSASGLFTAAHVGKPIMVSGALGVANIPLITTIASYQSATQVTLTATASVTASSLPAIWGTDDTTAIRSAVTAAKNYAVANEYYAEVEFDSGYYILAAAPVQTINPYYNTQILVPFAPSNTARKLIIGFVGAAVSTHFHFWASVEPNISGTCLVSLQTAPATVDATYGVQSVLGGPTGTSGFTGGFVNVKPAVRNLMVVCPAYTNMTAVDFTWLTGCYIDGSSAHVFAQPLSGGGSILNNMVDDGVFQSRLGVGLRTPAIGNNADVTIPDFASEGYTIGLRLPPEHVWIGNLKTIYNDVALVVDMVGLSNMSHGLKISRWTPEVYNGGVLVSGGGGAYVDLMMATEDSAAAYDVSDSGNVLRGSIDFFDWVDSRAPVVIGAANVRIIDHRIGRGAATPPAVPASTTPLTNPFWRDAAVAIVGGTVTVIAVDGTSSGLTAGVVIVPSGKTITLTYSSAPTWTWVLL